MEHPSIKEVAVIGIPDEISGQLPKAFIVLNKQSKLITKKEIQIFLKGKLADYKQLSGGIKFLDKLPRNPLGKINKKSLLDL